MDIRKSVVIDKFVQKDDQGQFNYSHCKVKIFVDTDVRAKNIL